ncbi:ABC transporter ATP-binding protein [Corticicoccus populi]|uniref:ABC transporter ATP-binding protein n=1 Tax=Corticicoccus populi TaxID=1812821 RepID=A0ABW5WZE2_9STAP
MTLEVKDLTISYGRKTVLKDINFKIPDNTIIGLVAPNGTGKTTLFNALIRFIPLEKGEVIIDGVKYSNASKDIKALHKKVTFFPDQAELYDDFSGYEHIQMYRDIWNKKERDIDGIIDRLNMSDYVMNKVKTYSLGMRQRLCFAMMIAADTKVMFMDEIMNGLDPVNVELVTSVLQEIKKDGKIIIVASHLLENLDDYADEIYFLNHKDVYYTYDRKKEVDEYVKGYIKHDDVKDILPLPEGTMYLANNRVCIPTKDMKKEEVFHIMQRLRTLSSDSVSLGPLGTNEHYLRIYKGEQAYEES